MADIENALIMGSIYDPDTDCRYVLLRCTAKAWDEYERQMEDELDG